jgi:hypothetical protein
MAEEQQEQHMPAEGADDMPKAADLERQAGQVPDEGYIASLLTQIKEQQGMYRILYARNLLLHNELMHEKQTIERLNTLLEL